MAEVDQFGMDGARVSREGFKFQTGTSRTSIKTLALNFPVRNRIAFLPELVWALTIERLGFVEILAVLLRQPMVCLQLPVWLGCDQRRAGLGGKH